MNYNTIILDGFLVISMVPEGVRDVEPLPYILLDPRPSVSLQIDICN